MENTDSDEVDNLDNSDDLRKYYKYKICYKLKLDNEKEYTTKREYSEEVDNLDNSDDLRKGHKYKICYKLKLDNEKEYTTKRVIMKILKLDENNQYGYSMTKPLPTGCIKQDPDIIWTTFNLLLERVSLEDSIGYLFKVDIEFDYYNASAKQRVYNEIYPSITDKQTAIDPCERLVYQLLEQYSETEKGNSRAYRATKRAHAMLFKKRFSPMYLEDLAFVISRGGWSATKIYSHFTFNKRHLRKIFF